MKHIHLETCDSTQKYLCDLSMDSNIDYLVSTDSQTQGIGQRLNPWLSNKNSLCFSFTLKENKILSLTSIEIGLILSKYFEGLFVKWPNDLINKFGHKCGGILINKKGNQKPIIGIGLNLYSDQFEVSSTIKPGSIFQTQSDFNHKELSSEIFNYIKSNRLDNDQIYSLWNTNCYHQNKPIKLIDGENIFEGIFKGIGPYGEAIINHNGQDKLFVSGSIRFKN